MKERSHCSCGQGARRMPRTVAMLRGADAVQRWGTKMRYPYQASGSRTILVHVEKCMSCQCSEWSWPQGATATYSMQQVGRSQAETQSSCLMEFSATWRPQCPDLPCHFLIGPTESFLSSRALLGCYCRAVSSPRCSRQHTDPASMRIGLRQDQCLDDKQVIAPTRSSDNHPVHLEFLMPPGAGNGGGALVAQRSPLTPCEGDPLEWTAIQLARRWLSCPLPMTIEPFLLAFDSAKATPGGLS